LDILHILWRSGPSTVRDVHEALLQKRDVGYTTALKTLQIMAEKGLVERSGEGRAHVFHATQGPDATQQRIVGDLIDRLFDGASQKLVMHALSTRPSSAEELAEIRRLLDRLEEKAE
jgi:predicted transcriptional regulator